MSAFGFILILIAIIVTGNLILNRLRDMELFLTRMKNDLNDIRQQQGQSSVTTQKTQETASDHRQWMPKTEQPPLKEEITQPVESPKTMAAAVMPEPTIYQQTEMTKPLIDKKPSAAEQSQAKPFASATSATAESKPKQPSFSERHPDFEKFVGENLINKIGIAILVLGIGFFVKYAIDKEWINEIGRVFIGILCGGALIGVAHRMRKSFAAFSSVLIGGGLSVLYFTIGLAFMQYHLFSQEAAFGIMVVITGFAVTLALLYNRIELAVLALIGGFGTPFFVSTGQGNYLVLFTYLIILNSGMLVLAFYKKWNLVNVLSYIFTILIYSGWLIKDMNAKTPHYAGTLIFGTIFYAMFWLMNVVNNLKYKQKFETPEFSILLSNTFLYYLAGMLILRHISDGMYQGLFTVAMGIVNFTIAFAMHRKRAVDKNLFYMLIGLVLTFISLAAPIQLKGNHITLFWSAEAVLLLWLSQKSGIRVIKMASMAIGMLMLISLMMDWAQIYNTEAVQRIAFNRAFITGIVSSVALFLYYLLLKHETDASLFNNQISARIFRNVIGGIAIALIYFVIFIELTYQLNHSFALTDARNLVIWGYNFLFAAIMAFAFRKNTHVAGTIIWVCVIGLLSLFYALLYNPAVSMTRDEWLLGSAMCRTVFALHYIFSAVVLYLLYTFKERLKLLLEKQDNAWWFAIPLLVYWMSAELDHTVILFSKPKDDGVHNILQQVHKFGYPILWGITSFVLVIIGLRQKNKTLRVIGLSLFSLIVVKLFLFDVWGMSEGGKIAAFVLLGVLLLLVSFMYQKLKQMLTEDEATNNNQSSEAL